MRNKNHTRWDSCGCSRTTTTSCCYCRHRCCCFCGVDGGCRCCCCHCENKGTNVKLFLDRIVKIRWTCVSYFQQILLTCRMEHQECKQNSSNTRNQKKTKKDTHDHTHWCTTPTKIIATSISTSKLDLCTINFKKSWKYLYLFCWLRCDLGKSSSVTPIPSNHLFIHCSFFCFGWTECKSEILPVASGVHEW